MAVLIDTATMPPASPSRKSSPGGRLTGSALAVRLGWTQSKVSKLETGRQTATADDLRQWTEATGHPDALEDLHNRLRGLESHVRSWRRQLASGHKAVQDAMNAEHARTATFRVWENSAIPGILQTPEYARHIFTRYSELIRSPRDTEAAVRARIKRQAGLYEAGKKYRIIVWEAALYALVCPASTLSTQLDRLTGVVGMDTVELGVVPFGAVLRIPPSNGFWIYDDRLAVVEDWHAQLWLDSTDAIATYTRAWEMLRESAVYGADVHSVITRAARTFSAS
ncbi:helix-turn-helix transcriptional regulator [Streptomyces sp. NPDC088124]|uniref:helix-turn-helix domain-containing protein n=1 Tax=Streptomyces sp. NPDC088124 TaxID=3154654 RepID=UPI0034193423